MIERKFIIRCYSGSGPLNEFKGDVLETISSLERNILGGKGGGCSTSADAICIVEILQ